ncbi:hypothetical protein PR001_g12079 [Phytophthora rubi]|uniref:Uncharacterized protein n=1 Tax=Phytophthora rubi TaxID=129364 RepID=A0A6A3M4W8_9STRA|nr:hypothetical protein PR001_g12079 [Phytophthora rubi]
MTGRPCMRGRRPSANSAEPRRELSLSQLRCSTPADNRQRGTVQSTTPSLAVRHRCRPVQGSLRCKAGTNATPDPTRHKQLPAGRCAEQNTFLGRPTVHHASALRLLNLSAEYGARKK